MAQRRRTTSKEIYSDDGYVGQGEARDIPVDGDLAMMSNDGIESVEGPDAMSRVEALAFNEEKIVVVVADSADPNADDIIPVSVNGVRQFFQRGIKQAVRRKFVEALARAKVTTYQQNIFKNEMTGNVTQRMTPKTACKYPFSVVQDNNPRGVDWLKQVLAQA